MSEYYDIDLMDLNLANGFNIFGKENEYSGQSVSAGDDNSY